MNDFSNDPASVCKQIPANRFFEEEDIELFRIRSVIWQLSIKPAVRDVEAFVLDRTRMEEIDVFSVKIDTMPDAGGYSRLLSQIHKRILYPCVIFFEYKNKYKISAWKFLAGAVETEKNILKAPYISSWIYDPPISDKSQACKNAVEDLLLNGSGSIKTLYDSICQTILRCPPQFIGSRVHLKNLIYDLVGASGYSVIQKIDQTKRYIVLNDYNKYQKNEYGSSFKYTYEYEDIWFAFLNDEKIKSAIKRQRYRDMEDLVYSIDSRYE